MSRINLSVAVSTHQQQPGTSRLIEYRIDQRDRRGTRPLQIVENQNHRPGQRRHRIQKIQNHLNQLIPVHPHIGQTRTTCSPDQRRELRHHRRQHDRVATQRLSEATLQISQLTVRLSQQRLTQPAQRLLNPVGVHILAILIELTRHEPAATGRHDRP
jgi:hypothetical protein